MDQWFNSQLQRVQSRAGIDLKGCLVWQGGPYNITRYKYGAIRITNPMHGGASKVEYVHRLVYQCANHLNQLPEGLDVSHRCHNSHCVREDHLILEPHAVNLDRIQCELEGECMGTHAPHCIFP